MKTDAAVSAIGVPRRVRGDLRVTGLVEDGAMVEKGDFLIQFDTSQELTLDRI